MNETVSNLLTVLSGEMARRVFTTVITLVVGVLVIRLVMALVKRALGRSKLEKAAHSLILSILNVALYVLLFLSAASALGIDVTGIVALASVLTLAVSLALQNMLANVIGGFTILTTHPFRSGDYVDIGSSSGVVKEISMTYTVLATPDNKIVSIPNSSVVAAQITNYSSSGTRRVDIPVSASYDSPVDDVLAALMDAAMTDKVLTDPAPFAGLTAYGDSNIEYVLRVWVRTEDYWDVYFRLNKRVSECFARNGVAMSYPHMNVHVN